MNAPENAAAVALRAVRRSASGGAACALRGAMDMCSPLDDRSAHICAMRDAQLQGNVPGGREEHNRRIRGAHMCAERGGMREDVDMTPRADSRRAASDPTRLLRVARAHYLQGESMVSLADREGLSRWQIARILDEARSLGIVTITVGDPAEYDERLGEEVSELLGLKRTVVVGPTRRLGLEPSLGSVGGALAEYLTGQVREGQAVGLTWSRVIESMAAQLGQLEPCDVVQLAGALTLTGDRMGSVEVIRQVARVAQGTAYPLYAPMVVESPGVRRALELQEEIASCLERSARLDLAVVSVGTWSESGSSLYSQLPAELAQEVADAGAVGEISGRVFGAEGEAVSDELDGRVLGITSEQLRQVPHIVATSYGAHRAAATIVAARAGFAHTLIVDAPLARAIVRKLRGGHD